MVHRRFLLIGLSVVLLSSCASKGRVRREVVIGKELYQVAMPVGRDIVHPEYGKEEWFGIGPLSGEGKVLANGLVEAHVFAKGVTVVTVQLNIEAPPKGSIYAAWLSKPGTSEFIRVGALDAPFKDVRHFLGVPLDRDLRAFTTAEVRLEKESGPTEGDPVQAKGAMKERRR